MSPPSKSKPPHATQKNTCFGCGEGNPDGMQLKFAPVEGAARGLVRSETRIPRKFTGAPTFLHGGVVATILDEAMSKVNAFLGYTGVTKQMAIDYKKPVPPEELIVIEARHIQKRGRAVYNQGEIRSADGTVLASGKAKFVLLSREAIERLTNNLVP